MRYVCPEIDRRRGQVGVAELVLYVVQGHTSIQGRHCMTVPQSVRRNDVQSPSVLVPSINPLYPRILSGLAHDLSNPPLGYMPTQVPARKKPVGAVWAGIEPRSDGEYQAGRDQDGPVLVGLRPVGFEVDQTLIQVDVSEPGPNQLAHSGAGAEEEGEDQPIAAGVRHFDQG